MVRHSHNAIITRSVNAEYPIEVTEEGIVISFNDEHRQKVEFLFEVTEEGIVICVNEEQQCNNCDIMEQFDFNGLEIMFPISDGK